MGVVYYFLILAVLPLSSLSVETSFKNNGCSATRNCCLWYLHTWRCQTFLLSQKALIDLFDCKHKSLQIQRIVHSGHTIQSTRTQFRIWVLISQSYTCPRCSLGFILLTSPQPSSKCVILGGYHVVQILVWFETAFAFPVYNCTSARVSSTEFGTWEALKRKTTKNFPFLSLPLWWHVPFAWFARRRFRQVSRTLHPWNVFS